MKKNKRSATAHVWRFFRAGGFDQVRLDSAADLLALDTLDQKLWVALACPVDNVYFDTRTLSLIDTDGDRRVRAPELIAAIKWTASLLKNPEDIVGASRVFSLASLSDATEEGKTLITAMRNALAVLGKADTDPVTVADICSLEKTLSQKAFNGDGVITADATGDDALKKVIAEVIATLGAVTDRSGNPGINAEAIDTFFAKAAEFDAWVRDCENNEAIRPMKAETENAGKALLAVKAKIDDYFARCAIAAYDERALPALSGGENPFASISTETLPRAGSQTALLPLAAVKAGRPLPLDSGINPAWADAMNAFVTAVVRPLVGPSTTLSENDWQKILSTFAPWLAWQERKPTAMFDAIGVVRVREIPSGDTKQALMALVDKDKDLAVTFASLLDLEKLVRFHRDLHSLCTNFVNFKDFYACGGRAIFNAGTLFLDQRSCNLCLKVDDIGKHSAMAAMASTYLAYCECRRPGGAKMTIVAAFTNGDSDNLILGRNGVFYDRNGLDWDATVTKIIENPISLRQAFWQPYKGLVRMIETQVAKRATAAEAQSTAKLEQTAVATANVDANKPPPPPKKLDIGIVAALGVAAGALGTFVATVLGYAAGIVKLGPLAIAGAIVGVILLISAPSLILAYIKLRKRNLGPILDASGWAINAKARINVPFGTALTHVAALPAGAQRDLSDPYAEKKSPWPKVIVFALLLYAAWAILDHFGYINNWTGGRIGHKTVNESAAIDKNIPKQ